MKRENLDPVRFHNIVTGRVILRGDWVSIEQKNAEITRRERLINDGYVQLGGKWVTIDEKLAAYFNPPEKNVRKKDFGPQQ